MTLYRIYYTLITERASAHAQERLWRPDFCERATLRGAAQILKVESHRSVQFCAILQCGVNTYLARRRSKKKRGLEATETEVNTVFRNKDGNLVHQTFRLPAPTLCLMCVNDLCQNGPLLFILYRILGFRGATKRYPVNTA